MTTEEMAGGSAGKHRSQSAEHAAEPGGSPETEPPEMAPAAGVHHEVAVDAAAPVLPDDPQELQWDIERTREQLGETVEALAAKVDVKARAKDRASQVGGKIKGNASQAWQKAQAASSPAKDQIQNQASTAAAAIAKATPEPVRDVTRKAAATARERRVPLAVVAGVALLAALVIARWRRR